MGRAHEKSSQSMLLFLMQKNQITCIKNEVMVILLIEKVIDNKMFPKSTAGLYISDSYQRNFISHRHRIFYGLQTGSSSIVNCCPFYVPARLQKPKIPLSVSVKSFAPYKLKRRLFAALTVAVSWKCL